MPDTFHVAVFNAKFKPVTPNLISHQGPGCRVGHERFNLPFSGREFPCRDSEGLLAFHGSQMAFKMPGGKFGNIRVEGVGGNHGGFGAATGPVAAQIVLGEVPGTLVRHVAHHAVAARCATNQPGQKRLGCGPSSPSGWWLGSKERGGVRQRGMADSARADIADSHFTKVGAVAEPTADFTTGPRNIIVPGGMGGHPFRQVVARFAPCGPLEQSCDGRAVMRVRDKHRRGETVAEPVKKVLRDLHGHMEWLRGFRFGAQITNGGGADVDTSVNGTSFCGEPTGPDAFHEQFPDGKELGEHVSAFRGRGVELFGGADENLVAANDLPDDGEPIDGVSGKPVDLFDDEPVAFAAFHSGEDSLEAGSFQIRPGAVLIGFPVGNGGADHVGMHLDGGALIVGGDVAFPGTSPDPADANVSVQLHTIGSICTLALTSSGSCQDTHWAFLSLGNAKCTPLAWGERKQQ